MEDIANKLTELLSNAENIKGLQNLISSSSSSNEKPNEIPEIPPETINTMMKLMPIMSSMKKEDNNTRLLLALKPLLKKERQSKIDQSIKMLQLMRIIPLIKNFSREV